MPHNNKNRINNIEDRGEFPVFLNRSIPADEGEIIIHKHLLFRVISESDVSVRFNWYSLDETIVIPSNIVSNGKTYDVTEIEDCGFIGKSHLTSISIPDSVIVIGNNAFNGCSGLVSIFIPNSVRIIGNYAFEDCIALTTFNIPESVHTLGHSILSGCHNLEQIIVEKENKHFCSIDGVLFNIDMTELIQCPGSKEEFAFTNQVRSIGTGAFCGCNRLQSITVPDSVKVINNYAFSGCSKLSSVTIPDSVISVGECAFAYCSRIISITVGNSVTTLGEYSFGGSESIRVILYKSDSPIESEEKIFDEITYENATLYVPEAAIGKCKLINPWKKFRRIIPLTS